MIEMLSFFVQIEDFSSQRDMKRFTMIDRKLIHKRSSKFFTLEV